MSEVQDIMSKCNVCQNATWDTKDCISDHYHCAFFNKFLPHRKLLHKYVIQSPSLAFRVCIYKIFILQYTRL